MSDRLTDPFSSFENLLRHFQGRLWTTLAEDFLDFDFRAGTLVFEELPKEEVMLNKLLRAEKGVLESERLNSEI